MNKFALRTAGLGLLAALSCITHGAVAQSTNLIVNGGFESGSFSGYNTTNLNFTQVTSSGIIGYSPANGNYYAALGNTGSAGVFSQTFSVAAGTPLTVSFSYASNGTPGYINALFNNVPVITLTNPPATTGYVNVAANVVANGTDTLSISSQNDPSYFALDDLSVTSSGSLSGGAPTPEVNAGLGILLAGASLAFLRRKRGSRHETMAA